MSNHTPTRDEPDIVDEEPLFYDEDAAVDQYTERQGFEPGMTTAQRRQMSLRRVEERREQQWLDAQLKDWDDY